LQGVNWFHLAQGMEKFWEVGNTILHLRVSSNAGNFLTGWQADVL
jgi:hypothetical protein